MNDVEDFLNDLRSELREAQEKRAAFVRQKFTYVIGFLGIGSLSIGDFRPSALLYLAPFISFTFDLYIVGEDFGIKRIGGFLGRKESKAPDEEKKWEKWVRQNRDPFSKMAGSLLSIMVFLASILVLWSQERNNLIYWIWIAVNIIILIGIWKYSRILNEKVQQFEAKSE